ncbi:MAG: O-antigen ligase family protein [Solirubrobacterales bacterium]
MTTLDLWLSDSLGGARPEDEIWLARLRGLALAGAAVTLPMSAWKAIGPLTTADLLLAAAVLLFLPRLDLVAARKLWFPALAIALATFGGVIGTVVSGSDVVASVEILGRVLAASVGAMVLVACWRPGLEQVRSFGWLWVTGGVASALVALLIPHLHMFLRPSGLTPHPNHLAIISVVLLGISLALILSERARSDGFGGLRAWAGLAAAGLLFASVVASGSRAGLGAALIAALLAVVASRDRSIVRVAVGTAAIGLVAVVILLGALGQDNAFERITGGDTASDTATSDAVRDAKNAAAWDRFTEHPVTGVGFGEIFEAHIFLLQFASGAGILGIIAGFMIIFLAIRSYVVAVWRRMADDPPYWVAAGGFAAAVIGYLAASIFQNILWDRNVWMAIVLMTWLAASSDELERPAPIGSMSA